ncbi:helix-turn-helix domain-containing protein [Sphingobacterium spiritivorum]|uniref:helix-turn-helix domain-containing protein n=2 Tax=Sphingobacterium spiritivorum TaxID=258 RepID=UPI003DA3EA5B
MSLENCNTRTISMPIDFGIHLSDSIHHHLPQAFNNIRRDVYIILLTQDKPYRLYIGDSEVELAPHTLAYINPNIATRFIPQGDAHMHVLYFTTDFYAQSSRDTFFLSQSPLFKENINLFQLSEEGILYSTNLINLLYNIRDKYKEKIYQDLLHNLLEQILLLGMIYNPHHIEYIHSENSEEFLSRYFGKLLEQHLATEKSVKFYADLLQVSSRKLTAATRQVLGKTPKEIILEHITQEAKRKLTNTHKSIKEIAYALGYKDENNFSSLFTKEVGCSPKIYRRRNQYPPKD